MQSNLKQHTDEWRRLRYSCITGTRFTRVLGCTSTRVRLVKELRAERDALESGEEIVFDDPDFPNGQHGRDMEHRALAEYQVRYFLDDHVIQRPALLVMKGHKWLKFSPDAIEAMQEGWDEYSKLLEVKCPVDPSVHLATLHGGMPLDHSPQVQGGLMVSGLNLANFISYHRGFPPKDQLYIQPVERNDSLISTLESACLDILEHVKNRTVPKEHTITSIPKMF
jgi:hypothetical protein